MSDFPKILSVYSHKGGVGKTTLVHTIAESVKQNLKFQRILLVDLDTQMNLTCKLLGSEQKFGEYIDSLAGEAARENQDIKSKLARITDFHFQKDVNPNPMMVWQQNNTRRSPCIHLIPGYPEMKLLSSHITKEIESPGERLNWCLSIKNLIGEYHKIFSYDLVILDLGPDLYAINCCALWTSDYVLIPCTADIYSAMSFRLVGQEIFDMSGNSMYRRFESHLKVIGFIPNRVKTYNESPTDAQQAGICVLRENFERHLGNYYQRDLFPERHSVFFKLVSGAITGNETKSLWNLDYSRDEAERKLMITNLRKLVCWLNEAIL